MNVVKEYRGYTISLDNNYQFVIEGPDFDERRRQSQPSLAEAVKLVDDHLASAVKQKKAEANLKIAALTQEGVHITVTGIHAGRSITVSKPPTPDGTTYYPAVDWIERLLVERLALRAKVQLIDKELRRVEVTGNRGYGRLAEEKFDEAIAKLVADFERAKGAANTMPADTVPGMRPAITSAAVVEALSASADSKR